MVKKLYDKEKPTLHGPEPAFLRFFGLFWTFLGFFGLSMIVVGRKKLFEAC